MLSRRKCFNQKRKRATAAAASPRKAQSQINCLPIGHQDKGINLKRSNHLLSKRRTESSIRESIAQESVRETNIAFMKGAGKSRLNRYQIHRR